MTEEAGRKRFLRIEAELEDAGWTPAASPIPGVGLPTLDSNGNPVNATPYATEKGSPLP